MTELVEIAKITLPAGLVLYAMYLVVRSFLNKEYDRMKIDARLASQKQTLPLKIQALERMAIFLERITPSSLLLRVSQGGMTAKELQIMAVNEVREEFEHNLAQQVFISEELWETVKSAKENVISILNAAMDEVKEDDPSVELAKKVAEIVMHQQQSPTDYALSMLRKESKAIFD